MDVNTLIDTSYLYTVPPYSLNKESKEKCFNEIINELNNHHYLNSIKYRNICDAFNYKLNCSKLSEVPFIPVRLFKYDRVHSITEEKVFKTLTSSGTSGQAPSIITLDNFTAKRQTKTLNIIMKEVLTNPRMPMVIIDFPNVRDSRNSFNARAAGIAGFSMFGKNPIYALDESGKINYALLESYITKNHATPIFVFGFTFLIWSKFVEQILKDKKLISFPKKSVLMHGGGWKKLEQERVSPEVFNDTINNYLSIPKVVNYYGMVEQVGSIFTECSQGYYHTTNFNDIFIRSANDHRILENGDMGLIQLLSILPSSYPGHSILTEDLGIIHGVDACKCGNLGKFFTIHGRQKNSEPRGCSDVIR
jgi:hypothetical protein